MRVFALAALALVLGCSGCHPTPNPVTPTTGDAAPTTCLDLCRHGSDLGCPWAQPTPAGADCVTVCANYQAAGIAPWDLACRASAPTCAAVDACR